MTIANANLEGSWTLKAAVPPASTKHENYS